MNFLLYRQLVLYYLDVDVPDIYGSKLCHKEVHILSGVKCVITISRGQLFKALLAD